MKISQDTSIPVLSVPDPSPGLIVKTICEDELDVGLLCLDEKEQQTLLTGKIFSTISSLRLDFDGEQHDIAFSDIYYFEVGDGSGRTKFHVIKPDKMCCTIIFQFE